MALLAVRNRDITYFFDTYCSNLFDTHARSKALASLLPRMHLAKYDFVVRLFKMLGYDHARIYVRIYITSIHRSTHVHVVTIHNI